MSETVDLGPLTLRRGGPQWRFVFTSPQQVTLELPPNYEANLAQTIPDLLGAEADIALVMDLDNIPAISSRQLGVMLALHKALRPRYKRLPLVNTSPAVRHLFAVTRTGQFFEVQ